MKTIVLKKWDMASFGESKDFSEMRYVSPIRYFYQCEKCGEYLKATCLNPKKGKHER